MVPSFIPRLQGVALTRGLQSQALSVVILAAGQGTRMRSGLPKVLQPLAGKPLLAHVINAARDLAPAQLLVVHGHGAELVRETFRDEDLQWVLQAEQLGTGHAVAQAIDSIPDENKVLILYGDVPLIEVSTLERLLDATHEDMLALLTVDLPNPAGYGRIVRDQQGGIQRIVEHKDASDSERNINEVNTGLMALPAKRLREWIARLDNRNSQGEYYLTDIISMAASENVRVNGIKAVSADEVHGINDKHQLAQAEAILRKRHAERLMRDGVTLVDPARIDVRGELVCGQDVFIDVNVLIEGRVKLANNVTIGPSCVLKNCDIGAGTVIEAFTHIEDAAIGAKCKIGPYARLRPGSVLRNEVRIGNFVETKNSEFSQASKANHLAYVGDASVGAAVNIGAGTITCNYDGANKHRTIIEDGAFIGSNSSLVAPVRIGKNATIGAGSTVTKDAPAEMLTVSRSRQATVNGWQRPKKKS